MFIPSVARAGQYERPKRECTDSFDQTFTKSLSRDGRARSMHLFRKKVHPKTWVPNSLRELIPKSAAICARLK